MEFLVISIIVLVLVGCASFYYWYNRKTPESSEPLRKVELHPSYLMDESFGIQILPVSEEKSTQNPAKMARPKLTKVEGGPSKKPTKKATKPKTTEPKNQKPTNQKPKNRKPRSTKKPSEQK
jgi:outer membrane biosynthesis protein TonB